VGTDFLSQGARTAVGAFFVYGAKSVQPVPPIDPSRGMSAAVLMGMAVALWVMIEFLDIYFKRLDTTKRRKPPRRNLTQEIASNLVQDILSTLGMAPASRGANGRNRSRRKR